ncbi:MAG TPA: ATP-binding protein [Thermomicrobiales bacterium]|nr:ATP-binding protein [Thermomicrobiales bacterium]
MNSPDRSGETPRETARSVVPKPLHRRPEWLHLLRVRLALPFIALTTLVLIVLYLVISESTERIYIDRLHDELVSQANLVAFSITRAPEVGGSTTELSALIDNLSRLSDARLTVIGPDGDVIADSQADASLMENHNSRPEVIQARRSGSGDAARVSSTVEERFLYVAVLVPESNGQVLRLAVPLDDVEATVSAAQRSILAAVAFVIVASIIAAWIIAGRLARPLQQLRDQAKGVATGDFSSRVALTGSVEIDAVADAFNTMTAGLELSLQEQEKTSVRLQAIMEGLADGVVLTDENGLVLRMNRSAQALLGTDERSAQGRPFVQVTRDHEMARVLGSALRGKKNPSSTVVFGMERLVILVSARTVEGAHERLGLVVLRDVSELRRLETVRREFVANVSHELRTPLTSIRALVETLEGGVVEEEEMARDFLGRIVGEVNRLNALVEDLLDFARLEAGRSPLQLETVDLGEVVRAGADRLRTQIDRAELSFVVNVEDDLPQVEIDARRMEQVLLNLIHNAIKFTPAGGEIVISVWRKKGEIAVEVRDTGIGIAPEELDRLFERFYKSDRARHSVGTGLGLAIAKNIVQLHGGEITVSSAPGEGSTFTFTLPIRRKRARKRARRHAIGLA